MHSVIHTDKALAALQSVQDGDIDAFTALEIIANAIKENLDLIDAVPNVGNAALIADIFLVELFPNDPMSKITRNNLDANSFLNMSNDEPHEYSIYRASAVFASSVEHSWSNKAPKKGGAIVDKYIEASGYLPDDVREY